MFQPSLAHPLIREALALHGWTAEKVMKEEQWKKGFGLSWKSQWDQIPGLEVGLVMSSVQWRTAGFTIKKVNGIWDAEIIISAQIPDTIIATAIGRRLSDIVSINGGEEVDILTIGGGLLTRLRVSIPNNI